MKLANPSGDSADLRPGDHLSCQHHTEPEYRALKEIIERNMDGILIVDGRGIVQSANRVAEALFDLQKEEIIGEMFGFPSVGEESTEINIIRGSGRAVTAEMRAVKVGVNGKSTYITSIRDITEKKLQESSLKPEGARLPSEKTKPPGGPKVRCKFGEVIGKSPAMQEVYRLISMASASGANVVICGESGTGKELIARAIHEMGERREKTFVPVNCGAVPEPLFESEFFGYRKGAFTGAQMDKHGFFDLANGGTLFLDEVGELTPNMQVKLLRAIEGGGYTPVGDPKIRKTNARIVAASNRDLPGMVKRGEMREDFYYRIHVIPIHIPPLRERKEDIPLLVEFFSQSGRNGTREHLIPQEIMDDLCKYEWPGNVRELQNVLHRYSTVKQLEFLSPGQIRKDHGKEAAGKVDRDLLTFRESIQEFEKKLILEALERSQWNKAKASTMLGLPRRTFFRKLQNFGLKARAKIT